MSDLSAIPELISAYGLITLVPLAILEGPIVTIIAGWLASIGLLNPLGVLVAAVVGDLLGDLLLYGIGRGLRLDRLPYVGRWLRLPRTQLVPLVRTIRDNGTKILIIGKVTHAAGFAVLLAAGAAKMNLLQFTLINLLCNVPKSAIFVTLGYLVGEAYGRASAWLGWGSAVVFVGLLAGGFWWLMQRRAAIC
ncbi:DedA family protein [Neogemmobacter tilapiae]|uniref:Membrane protein n=1 Tax=Neogemmobacter tilapiae TaxID=875041 RepID=A0A918TVV8_9RHOB|nr:VTT domain-containing protein [Gemmobacter tilapiae]GHC64811.1 membrane protein [Gemmobacter tilapiae]